MPPRRFSLSRESVESLLGLDDPQREFDHELFLDALLLAAHARTSVSGGKPKDGRTGPVKGKAKATAPEGPASSKPDAPPSRPPDSPVSTPRADDGVKAGDLFDAGSGISIEEPSLIRARRSRVPLPSALPRARDMAEALRPLKKRVASRLSWVLDEQRSIERSAETGVLQAVQRPRQERWLEVALVLDESKSMRLWTATLADLRKLLESHGAFRNVTTWSLNGDADSPKLYRERSLPGKRRRLRDPKELLDSEGRRLILVASDLTSPSWRSGQGFEWMLEWSRSSPVAVIEMLPPRLWPSTPLGANTTPLKADRAAQPSSRLSLARYPGGRRKYQFPLLTLEPAAFGAWGQLVANLGLATTTGYAFDECPVVPLASSQGGLDGAERVKRFRRAVSVEAFQIAVHLAAVPLSLPIMRFVQELAVDRENARLTQLAEIVLGGIAEHLPEPPARFQANDCLYRFASGVRQALLPYLGKDRALEVIEQVGEQIAKRLGIGTQDFRAILADPAGPLTVELDSTTQRFARLRLDVLKYWGLDPGLTTQPGYPAGLKLVGRETYEFDRIRQLLWYPDGSRLVLRGLYNIEVRKTDGRAEFSGQSDDKEWFISVDVSRQGSFLASIFEAKSDVTALVNWPGLTTGKVKHQASAVWRADQRLGPLVCDADGTVYPLKDRVVGRDVSRRLSTAMRRWQDAIRYEAVVSASSDGSVSCWVLLDGKVHRFRTAELERQPNGRVVLAVQPPWIAFAQGEVVTLLRWDIPENFKETGFPNLVRKRRFESEVMDLAFADGHNILAVAERIGAVHLVTADAMQLRTSFELDPAEPRSTAVTFGRDGRLTVARSRKIRHFEVDFDLLLRDAWKPNGVLVLVGRGWGEEVRAIGRALADYGYEVVANGPFDCLDGHSKRLAELGVAWSAAAARTVDAILEFSPGSEAASTGPRRVAVTAGRVSLAGSGDGVFESFQRHNIPVELQVAIALNAAIFEQVQAAMEADPHGLRDIQDSQEPVLRSLLKAWRKETPDSYLEILEKHLLQFITRRGISYVIPPEEMYVPLRTVDGKALEDLLEEHSRLHLIGESGSGKSTFLRKVAYGLCQGWRDEKPHVGRQRLPILIQIPEFVDLLARETNGPGGESADWIPRLLDHQNREQHWGLSHSYFVRRLEAGECMVLADGLDEAPEGEGRKRIVRIFENAATAFPQCGFVITSRPQGRGGGAGLARFENVHLAGLDQSSISLYIRQFAQAMQLSETRVRELIDVIERPEVRPLAANPLMLSIIAGLYSSEEGRLPADRAQLYEAILEQLASRRERLEIWQQLEIWQRLALYMQDHPSGMRLVRISIREARELLSREFQGEIDLDNLLQDASGILLAEGDHLAFRHLAFQEYLAARELAKLPESVILGRFTSDGRLYQPDWRETAKLLLSIFEGQGPGRLDALVDAHRSSPLPEKARFAGLLSDAMRDLDVPVTAACKGLVDEVMGIFEPGESQKIHLKTRIEAADALAQVFDPRLHDDAKNWVNIPAGTFWMGAQQKDEKGRNYDPQAYSDESPVHEVSLRGFRIRRFPVTVQEYAAFLAANGYSNRNHWKAGGFENFKQPDKWEDQTTYPSRPVVGVSWFEAAAYCAWAGGRLPTEAEWERAARGPSSARFPWGNAPELDAARANYRGGPGHPTPVGIYPLGNSAEGMSDLLGNVWEWTADWFGEGYYGRSPQVDPRGKTKGAGRVMRGGSWDFIPEIVRVSSRGGLEPAIRDDDIGFRCAGELP